MDLAQFRSGALAAGSPGGGDTRRTTLDAIYATGHWLLDGDRVADAARVFRALAQAAPRDERGWLGMGECHERIDQPRIAAQLYGAGGVVSDPPVRCLLAHARVLGRLGRDAQAEQALAAAERAATLRADDELTALVAAERRRAP